MAHGKIIFKPIQDICDYTIDKHLKISSTGFYGGSAYQHYAIVLPDGADNGWREKGIVRY
jgi:hypothetical protein